MRAPKWSCVLFVEGDEAPTLVVDAQVDAPSMDRWLCFPRPNRLLVFPGNRLHGVVPLRRPAPRITLMLGLWDREPERTRGLGPNMPFVGADWCPAYHGSSTTQLDLVACPTVAPVWEAVPPVDVDLRCPDVHFTGRFFLHGDDAVEDIRRDVLSAVNFIDLRRLKKERLRHKLLKKRKK